MILERIDGSESLILWLQEGNPGGNPGRSKLSESIGEQENLKARLLKTNPRATIRQVHFGNTRLEDILDIRGFNLNAILEIEPEGKSIRPPSLRGLPGRRNSVLEAAPNGAQCRVC